MTASTFGPQAVRKAIYTLLSSDSALTALLGGVNRIYDEGVPQSQTFPYISLTETPWQNRGNHSWDGMISEPQVNVWHRGDILPSAKPVHAIQKRVDELLHNVDLNITGWKTVALNRAFTTILTEDDTVTLHGVQRFEIMIGESSA